MKIVPLPGRERVKELGRRASWQASPRQAPHEARREPRPPDLHRFFIFHSLRGAGVGVPNLKDPIGRLRPLGPSREGFSQTLIRKEQSMKRQARLILVCFGLISGLVAYFSFSATREDLDPLKVAPETHKLVFENALVRVIEAKVPTGTLERKHSHP